MKKYNYILILMLLLFISCKTLEVVKEVPVEVEKIKTEYIYKQLVDTVIYRDSTSNIIRNDTVYLYKFKYIQQTKITNDTIRLIDSIPTVIKVTDTVTVKTNILKWWQKVLIALGIIFLTIIGFKLFMFIKKIWI